MSEVLIHLIIPAAALIIAGYDRRLVLLFCPLAVIPDIDVIFGAHRSFLHSLIFLGALSVGFVIYTIRYKPEWKSQAIIISLLLLSHPILDLFTAPVQLFWPLDSYYWVEIQAPTFDVSTLSIDFGAFFIIFHIYTPQAAEVVLGSGGAFGLFTNEGLMAFLLLGIAITYWLIRSRKSADSQKSLVIQPAEGHT